MEARACLLLLAALFALDASAATLPAYGSSAPLRTLAPTTRVQSESTPPLRRITARVLNAPRAGAASAAPQFTLPSGAGAPAMSQVRSASGSINLEGLRAGDGSVGGALGDVQYMQHANGQLAVYRKDDGALLFGPVPVNALFTDAQPSLIGAACGAASGAEATVQFDQLASRWIVSYRGRAASGPYYLCIAVSASFDASGSYHRYALAMQTPTGWPLYFDDPLMAVWPDAYYFSVNLFDSMAGSYRGPRICGIERQALLRGTDAPLRCRDLGDSVTPLAPASLDAVAGAPQRTSAALFLALEVSSSGQGERLLLWRFSFSANFLSAPLAIPVAPFTIACPGASACIAQPAPGARLAALGERLMPRPVYRNDEGRNTLLAAHAVQMAGGQLGLRWYEIGDPFGAARVHQQGSIAPDAASRWMGSIGMDKAGNIVLGYSVASIDTPPGIRYSGRQRTDPPGRMQGEAYIFNGYGVQPDDARPAQASGALALDPVDGCTFWYTQRYLPSTGAANWRTRIASFKFEGCH